MKINEIVQSLDELAPFYLQENYDNAGLIIGHPDWETDGCLICVDVNEAVIEEAVRLNFRLVVSHHPVIFKGLSRITGQTSTERIVARALQEEVAVIAMHTNLDNSKEGVNRILAEKLGMRDLAILRKTKMLLKKLVTFCPTEFAGKVREAIFEAGAGHIGEYDRCSFNAEGSGTYRAGDQANPFAGKIGEFHTEPETRIETVFPAYRQKSIIRALLDSHPYEEVAYDIYPLENEYDQAGAGMIGNLEQKMSEMQFLVLLKDVLNIPYIRHSPLLGKKVGKVAVCGGSGSFLIADAIQQKADFFVSSDFRYHQFFDAEGRIVIADTGHFESEQFTCDLLADYLKKKFPTFAILISETPVSPVNYF